MAFDGCAAVLYFIELHVRLVHSNSMSYTRLELKDEPPSEKLAIFYTS